ncbi:glutathione S-transferase [Bordetella genomosp. 9]|uniref:Glutathione S-transferase n=1 Tax=Bordetella genomosp. 9 TaxID=1416803 RepID=A0A261R6A5_9BORD|nr:glutathione S-transferase family protein [Bordetella genomosp. 9]OZI20471.1 glutathione S-transferase [Bordetella genomosp. 9]
MLALYSYPGLFGVADNNPFGLKVFAFLRLAGLPFSHHHIFDSRQAPHGQLPYIDDDGTLVGDSSAIVAHLVGRHRLSIDSGLSAPQRIQAFCINRVLDDLYWSMSYSRWKDDRYWPAFRDAVLRTHPTVSAEEMDAARAYNFERYRYQGIGRYAPEEAYKRGLDDLRAVAGMLENGPFFFGASPTSIDASIYGFVANILFYPIDTPLREYVVSQPGLALHCQAVHDHVMGAAAPG